MNRARSTLALALLAVAAFAPESSAQNLQTGDKTPLLLRADQPNRPGPYPGSNGAPGDPSMASEYNAIRDGINLNGVGILYTPDPANPGYAFACTASRIGYRTMITAAHCVTDQNTGQILTQNTDFYAFGPGSTNGSKALVGMTSSSVVVRPEWQGFNNSTYLGHDVALVHFGFTLPSWMTTYGLFTPDPLFAPSTHVGIGGYGNGAQGDVGFDFNRRYGQNRVDYYFDDPNYSDWNILYTDFDNGNPINDAFCYVNAFFCDLGRGATESGLAGGDSGGPLFVGTQIAGVASFGTYLCSQTECPASPPLLDPNVDDGFGSLNGYAGVRGNEDFINGELSTIPEPGSVILLGTGLLVIGGFVGRRRK